MPTRRPVVNISVAFIVLTLAAFILFPSGYIIQTPGPAYNVLGKSQDTGKAMIQIKDDNGSSTSNSSTASSKTSDNTDDGAIILLTVSVRGGPGSYMNSLFVAPYLLDKEAEILPVEVVYRVGISGDEAHEEVATQMDESQHTSVTAAVSLLQKQWQYALDPDTVKIAIDDVGGPSAGLAFALGIIQKTGVEDLARGRTIATTGAVDDEGNVLPIGGVQQKMEAATKKGAQILLVPEDNYAMLHDIPDSLKVIPVATLSDAVQALVK